MIVEVSWSQQADESFGSNIKYLREEWNEKVVQKFIPQTEQAIIRLQRFPESYLLGNKSKLYRKVKLNKYIVLFYRYYTTENKITVITFWNVKQNPENFRY